MGISFTCEVKKYQHIYIIHVNFNFPFRLEPKVGLHITHECTSWLRFYGE